MNSKIETLKELKEMTDEISKEERLILSGLLVKLKIINRHIGCCYMSHYEKITICAYDSSGAPDIDRELFETDNFDALIDFSLIDYKDAIVSVMTEFFES